MVIGDKVMEAHALRGTAELTLQMDDLKHAEELFWEALEALQKIGDEFCVARSTTGLAGVAQRRGDFEQATQLLKQSLQSFETLGIEDSMAWVIERFAALAKSTGRGKRSAKLLGAAEIHFGGSGTLPPIQKGEHELLVASTRELLGNQAFEQLIAEGAAMSLQEAVSYALEEKRDD